MTPIRTLIADDEPLGRQRIRSLLQGDPEIDVIAECGDGPETVAALQSESCDLVFLDVQMPRLNGLEVVQAVGPERMPAFIFVTAYDRYALRAFEVQALDYLLKPFDRDRFTKALERAKAVVGRVKNDDASQQLLNLLEEAKPGRKHLERLAIKCSGRVFFLRLDEVDWIEAAGNYLKLHVGKDFHLLRETVNNLEGRLDPKQFLRVHRSTIVNIDRIKEFQPLFHGDYVVILQDGTQLPVSRTYKQRLPEVFGQGG
jgi:two-component system LytT family response regulator